MNRLAITSILVALLAPACSKQTVCDIGGPLCDEELKPGACLVQSDCKPTMVCDMDPSSVSFHFCLFGLGDGSLDGGDDALGDASGKDTHADQAPECQNSSACTSELRPVCSAAGTCVPCTENTECQGMPGGRTFCAKTEGRCVTCLQSTDCGADAPICSGGVCKACGAAGVDTDSCMTRSAALPACAPSGRCVECNTSADCRAQTKPICDQTACRSCAVDAECTTAPGICMSHQDGRCASAAETVVVAAGDLQAAINEAVAGGKKLVLVTANSDRATFAGPMSLSIIGKGAQRPAVGGGPSRPGISVTGGSLYLRDLSLSNSAPGLSVTGGSVQVASCVLKDNPGGGVYVENGTLVLGTSTLTQNGPADDGGAIWGGLRIKSPGAETKLDRVSVIDNKAPGVSCSTAVTATGVLATGNSAANISATCQFMSCAAAGAACGAP